MSQIFTQISSFWDNLVLLKMQNPTHGTQFSSLNICVNKCCLIWSTTFTTPLYLTLSISFSFQDATLLNCAPCLFQEPSAEREGFGPDPAIAHLVSLT